MSLEDKIEELDRETKKMINTIPDAYFRPANVPYYKEHLQDWLIQWHEDNNKELPKGFWKKNKRQLIGMYYGIIIWQNKKKALYTNFLFEYEKMRGIKPDESNIKRKARLGHMQLNELKEKYEQAIAFKNNLKAIDGYPGNRYAEIYGIE